ncbi:MAG TPA: hypothetical protein VFK89_07945 [Actinomycetota bacterium]|nr:hypothetical protein [Actinomycetota bacterium]
MQPMWIYELLQKEIADDRLRMAGYHSRVARRRRERSERMRASAGRRLVRLGQRLQGICEPKVAPAVTLRRS